MSKHFTLLAILFLVVTSGRADAARAWRVSLPDTVFLAGGAAHLRDISQLPVPAGPGDLVLQADMRPNTAVRVSRRKILRELVVAGYATGVSFTGAEACYLVFGGAKVSGPALDLGIRHAVQGLVPATVAGAPGSWFDLELPSIEVSTSGDWSVNVARQELLAPGRNLVQVQLVDGHHREMFSATVVLHCYGETARAVVDVGRGTPLQPEQFQWEWKDRALLGAGVVAGQSGLSGASAARSISTGHLLRTADLKDTPLVLAGDPVELRVVRGRVSVTVRAFARQDGTVGQTIPVRNELTGRLVNARIAGPGLVEWRR